MTVVHWVPRNAARDIAAEALRSDRARPVAIHVRRHLARLIGGKLPVIIDESIPFHPGYEIVREAP